MGIFVALIFKKLFEIINSLTKLQAAGQQREIRKEKDKINQLRCWL